MPNSQRLEFPIQIRFRDFDSMGHVNNAVFSTFLEYARIEAFYNILGIDLAQSDLGMILAHLEIDYKVPIHYTSLNQSLKGRITAEIWVSKIGTTSFEFSYRLTNIQKTIVFAEGKTVQVLFDYKTQKKQLLPRKYIDQLLKYKF